MKIDEIDKKILEKLQGNARITNAQLSKEIGLSPAPTLERVKKLENLLLITNYHAEIDREKLGLGVSIFILITLSNHKLNKIESFVEKVNSIEDIVECHHITGSGDFLLKVVIESMGAYQKLILSTLTQIEEIGSMQSLVVLSTFKNSKVLKIK